MTAKLNLNTIILVWIALWCINFSNLGNYFLVIGFIMAVILLFRHKFVNQFVVSQIVFICFFSAIYAMATIVSNEKGIGFVIMYAVAPVSCYLIGYFYICHSKSPQNTIFSLADFFITCLFLYASLNMMFLFLHGWSYDMRGTYDIWTGVHINPTNQGGYFILTVIYIPFLLFFRKDINKKKQLRYCIQLVLSIIYTLLLANRTYFVILLSVAFISYLFYMQKIRNKSLFVFKTVLITFCSILIFALLYAIDFLNIQTFWKSTTFYTRMQYMGTKYDVTLKDNDRFPTWIKTIKTLPEHLWGGKPEGVTISYAHNMWLDIQWVGGVIALILISVITILFFYLLVRLFKQYKNNLYMQLFFVSYSFSMLLECAVEPIIEGYYYIFSIFFLMYGALSALYIRTDQIIHQEIGRN